MHGDKESYWIACELVGGLPCGLSPFSAGEVGMLVRPSPCIRKGNLLQFNPDTGAIVHCNCKKDRANFSSHVSQPVLAANVSKLRVIRNASTEEPPTPLPLLHVAPSKQSKENYIYTTICCLASWLHGRSRFANWRQQVVLLWSTSNLRAWMRMSSSPFARRMALAALTCLDLGRPNIWGT